MKWIIRITIVAVVLAVLFVSYLYFFGGLRLRMEMGAFAQRIATCEPFEQEAYQPLVRRSFSRSITPLEDGQCQFQFEGLGGEQIVCTLPEAEWAAFSEGHYVQRDNVDIWGNMSFRFSSENPDHVTAVLNSPACVVE